MPGAALPLVLATAIITAFGIYVPFSTFASRIGLQPLPPSYLPWLVGTLLTYCMLTQTIKVWYIRRFGRWL